MSKIYLAIINLLENGVALLDEQLNILLWNKWMEDATEQKEEAVKGRHITEVIPKLNHNIYQQMFEKALLEGQKSFCSAAMHGYFVKKCSGQKELLRQNMLIRHIQVDGETYIMLEIHDVTNHYERVKRLNQTLRNSIDVSKDLERYAFYDSLTGLPNRKFILDRIENLIEEEEDFTLFFLDLDGFKFVNDHFGHVKGDLLLQLIAERYEKITNDSVVFSRFGGDEFLLLVEGSLTIERVQKREQEIKKVLVEPFKIENQLLDVSASIGHASFPKDGLMVQQLINKADNQMYMNKNTGR